MNWFEKSRIYTTPEGEHVLFNGPTVGELIEELRKYDTDAPALVESKVETGDGKLEPYTFQPALNVFLHGGQVIVTFLPPPDTLFAAGEEA